MFWLIGTAFAFRNFLTSQRWEVSTDFFGENRDLLVLKWSGGLGEIPWPNQKSKKKLGNSFLTALSKNVFSSKAEQFSALGATYRGRAH